jgi:VWFA-related protein
MPTHITKTLAPLALAALLTAAQLHSQQRQPGPIHPPTQQPLQQQQTSTPAQQSPQSAAPAAQQSPTPESPKISVDVKEVTLYATVRDKKDKIINTLNKDNFKLDEDGRPQTISYFTKESDLPLTLGLLVDTSLSQRRVLDSERDASDGFLSKMLRPDKDQAFLIHFDREVELLQDLTNSRNKLRAGLQLLQTPSRTDDDNSTSGGNGGDNGGNSGGQNGGQGGPGGRHGRGGYGHSGGGGTLLYDAIYLASDEEMAKQQGRKALIILSDGVDRGSKETIGGAIEAAQRANTAIFSILFADDDAYNHAGFGGGGYGGRGQHGGRYPQENRPDGKKVLQRLSEETGGEFFQVTKKLPVEQIYAEIEEGLRNQYSLAYKPDRANPDATFHKIQLTVNQKDLLVQSRSGYYSGN